MNAALIILRVCVAPLQQQLRRSSSSSSRRRQCPGRRAVDGAFSFETFESQSV